MSNEKLNTIYGKSTFTYLSEKDTAFGKDDYHVTLEVPKDKAQVHVKTIEDIISKEVAEQHKLTPNNTAPLKRANKPYKEEGDMVTFKLHSKFKPKVWDKSQKEIGAEVNIWKGSTMWVNYKAQGYNKSIGLGCTLYISSVQIDDLVQGSADGSQCPFPKRETNGGVEFKNAGKVISL